MIQNNDITEDTVSAFSNAFLDVTNDSIRHEFPLKVYPNPFQNFLNVQSSINDNLILTDIHGRVLLEKGITSGFTRVSTGNITNGIYMVNLVEQNIQFKLIKQ